MNLLRRPWSFRAKFVLSTVLIALILPTTGGIILYDRELATAKSLIEDDLVTQLSHLAESLHPTLSFDDKLSANELISTLLINPQIKRVEVWQKDENSSDRSKYKLFASTATNKELPIVKETNPLSFNRKWTSNSLTLSQKVYAFGNLAGFIKAERSLSDLQEKRSSYLQLVLTSWLIIIGVIILVAIWYQYSLTAPLQELMKVAEKVSTEGSYDYRAKKLSEDEFGRLTTIFNQMLASISDANRRLLDSKREVESRVIERTKDLTVANEKLINEMSRREQANQELLLTKDKLSRQEKLASVGQLSSNIAHELRNPMAAIRNSVYFLGLQNFEDEKIKHHLEVFDRELTLGDEVIQRLLEMTRSEIIKFEKIDLKQIAQESHRLTDSSNLSELQFDADLDPFIINADRVLFRQVLSNLFLNSLQAHDLQSTEKCKIGIEAKKGKEKTNEIRVWDSGTGIRTEFQDNIFDPLISHKNNGAGLGLPLCRDILARHNGKISLEDSSDVGTTFLIELPPSQKNLT